MDVPKHDATNLGADANAAHDFLSELRTRVAFQPLPYQHGVESRALESLWELFSHARSAMKKYPGCREFSNIVVQMLNETLRPFTAKWHRAKQEGKLDSRDGNDEFRSDLRDVRVKLRECGKALFPLAYGKAAVLADTETPPAISDSDVESCLTDLSFGIPDDGSAAGGAESAAKIRTKNSPVSVGQINQAEEEAIEKRRSDLGVKRAKGKNAFGLGLSGGGIRSATFAIGVCQVLMKRQMFKDVDFMSTVSGGGYTGSLISSSGPDLGNPEGPDNSVMSHVRHHANYLTASNLTEAWSMAVTTVGGIVLNWSAPLVTIALLALASTCIQWSDEILRDILAIAGGASLLTLFLYGCLLRFHPIKPPLLRTLMAVSAVTIAAGSAVIISALAQWVRGNPHGPEAVGLTGVFATVIGAAPAVVRFLPVLKVASVRKKVLRGFLLLAGLLIPALAVIFFLCIRHYTEDSSTQLTFGISLDGSQVIAILIFILGVFSILALDINLTGPHRLYKERLAKTFIRETAGEKITLRLDKINANHEGPYHLLNATLNVPSNTSPAIRDRKCDFFLFSKFCAGSKTTGYAKTTEWQTNGRNISLATAMAISGAAASSSMGLGTIPTLRALLTLLNVRLGFWISHPHRSPLLGLRNPGFSCLLREMTAAFMSGREAWLNLSDGGHIENMAVYELLRRRCKFIVCVDGEADPDFGFGGLMTLIRHANIDFGIRIQPDLQALRPATEANLSRSHFSFCRIDYPAVADAPEGIGLFLYIKLSMTGNEPELVMQYRANHPDFPHESTLDQFFDQEQFEVYRQLGAHVADGMFSSALMNGKKPEDVTEWFRGLVTSLMEKLPK